MNIELSLMIDRPLPQGLQLLGLAVRDTNGRGGDRNQSILPGFLQPLGFGDARIEILAKPIGYRILVIQRESRHAAADAGIAHCSEDAIDGAFVYVGEVIVRRGCDTATHEIEDGWHGRIVGATLIAGAGHRVIEPEQALHEGGALGHAADAALYKMRMRVDQAGHDHEAIAAEDFFGGIGTRVTLAGRDDSALIDGKETIGKDTSLCIHGDDHAVNQSVYVLHRLAPY